MADSNKDTSTMLLSKMSKDPDTTLVFDGEKGKETVNVHATLLKLHSPVLDQAISLAPCSSTGVKRSTSGNSSSPGKQVSMPGTSKADFLVVARFIYPIMPLPKVSWDNLEVLLLEGQKWDMQVVLGHAAEFIEQNASSMDLTPSSAKYAFKWLQLTDAARLTDACNACADRSLALDRSSCQAEKLVGLSGQTLMYIIEKAVAERLDLGLEGKVTVPLVAAMEMRAIPYGMRIGKLSNMREFGSNRKVNIMSAGTC